MSKRKTKANVEKLVDAQARGRRSTSEKARSQGELDTRVSKGKVDRKSIS